MFGRKKARASKQTTPVTRESERGMAAKVAKLHGQRLAHAAAIKNKAAMSPAQKTKAISNSREQRNRSAPSV